MMLARSTTLRHPTGISIETPLLIPSFSSKGIRSGGMNIGDLYGIAAEFISDVMLISAFDVHYDFIDMPESEIVELTFVDSGGYEISDTADFSVVEGDYSQKMDWSANYLRDVYSEWPGHVPAVFVSFDSPKLRMPIPRQIEEAKNLLGQYPDQLQAFMVKPSTKGQSYVQHKEVIANMSDVGSFDILGITEREIGNSVLQRMERIALIRRAMDAAEVDTPIHIFGSLDPITSVLYFLSGAEIFDGLTWLRYGFLGGLACYYHNFGAMNAGIGISRQDRFVRSRMMVDNLGYLVRLRHQMQRFLLKTDGDFSQFDTNQGLFRESFDLLQTRIGRQ